MPKKKKKSESEEKKEFEIGVEDNKEKKLEIGTYKTDVIEKLG